MVTRSPMHKQEAVIAKQIAVLRRKRCKPSDEC